MKPALTWINHSGFLLESASGSKLISDPWLSGEILNKSWNLLAESFHDEKFLGQCDALWFSHEHPDHFAPGTIMRIPEAQRNKITVFYKRTKDRKVINFCTKAGFDVQELTARKSYRVNQDPNFTIEVQEVPFYDSFFLAKIDGLSVLNLNDCVIRDFSRFKKRFRIHSEIDIVLIQFGYANWTGNPGETEKMLLESQEKLDRIISMDRWLKPKAVVLSASFTFFSNEDNFFLNEGVFSVREVYERLTKALGATVAVLYPGDTMELHSLIHDSEEITENAIARYDRDQERVLGSGPLHHPEIIEPEELTAEFAQFRTRVLERNSAWFIGLIQFFRFLPRSIVIKLDNDQDKVYELSYYQINRTAKPWEISMSSDMLRFIFNFDYGFDSLEAGGRFTVASRSAHAKVFLFFGVLVLNNLGLTLGPAIVTNFAFIKRVLGKIFRQPQLKMD